MELYYYTHRGGVRERGGHGARAWSACPPQGKSGNGIVVLHNGGGCFQGVDRRGVTWVCEPAQCAACSVMARACKSTHSSHPASLSTGTGGTRDRRRAVRVPKDVDHG